MPCSLYSATKEYDHDKEHSSVSYTQFGPYCIRNKRQYCTTTGFPLHSNIHHRHQCLLAYVMTYDGQGSPKVIENSTIR